MRRILRDADADVICIAEGVGGLLPDFGDIIDSEGDYGDGLKPSKRKVLLWSRYRWIDKDNVGSPDLPSGRFVRGKLSTPLGDVVVIGVCVPYFDANVRTGRRDRQRWQDHTAYLEALRPIIEREKSAERLLVVGDYNQKLQPKSKKQRERSALLTSALCGLRPCTEGEIPGVGEQSIDHVAHSAALSPGAVSGWSSHAPDGTELSDHFGLKVDFT